MVEDKELKFEFQKNVLHIEMARLAFDGLSQYSSVECGDIETEIKNNYISMWSYGENGMTFLECEISKEKMCLIRNDVNDTDYRFPIPDLRDDIGFLFFQEEIIKNVNIFVQHFLGEKQV